MWSEPDQPLGWRMQAEGRMPRLERTPAQRGGRQPTLGRGMSLSRWCKARQTRGRGAPGQWALLNRCLKA